MTCAASKRTPDGTAAAPGAGTGKSAAAAAVTPLRIVYFAWVREKVGRSMEDVVLPEGLATVADLVAWQRERGDGFAEAFARPEVIRVAIDQTHVKSTASLAGAREIAFFPPVTGG